MTGDTGEVIRVLIADDHPMVRAGLRAMLNSPDIEVIAEAATGVEAVDLASELSPDVVLMDIRMPDVDGIEATAQLKKASPTTSVIIVTGVEDDDFLRRSIEAGAAGYLLKGAPREVLQQSIRVLKGGGSMIDRATLARLASTPRSTDAPEACGVLARLSPRETEVLIYIVYGLTNKEIAARMHYSLGTVKNTVQRIISKLGVADRTQATVIAVREGIERSVPEP